MSIFKIAVNIIVIAGMFYLTFVMALAGWFAGLRKGQAVTLLPENHRNVRSTAVQAGFALASLAIFVLIFYFLWIPLPVRISSTVLIILYAVGFAFFLAGLMMTYWARRTLGMMWGISTSRKVKLLPDHQLIQTGPYALVRHPMYLGWWLSVFGLLLIYHTWILVILLAMSLVVFYRRARLEERILAERFGETWQDYAARSKFMFPFFF
jgi:protein-S-isoprenylcysteine O-methyltransferase Ste14